MWKSFRRRFFALTFEQTSFSRRGFHGGAAPIRQRLEAVGGAFVTGCNLALEHGSPEFVGPALNAMESDVRGFAFEGAAMGLALLDFLTPWRRDRISKFLRGAGDAHAYMVHVGVGWVWARMPFGFRRRQKKLDPLLGWLAFDGWGFHEGFFHWPKYIAGQPARRKKYPVTSDAFSIRVWAARSGSSTAETSNSSRKQFRVFPPTGRPICGAASAWPRPTRESSARLRSANCVKSPAGFNRNSPKAQPSPPRPGNAQAI